MRVKRTDARMAARRSNSSAADLEKQLDLRTRERDEALEREKATAQVLRVISSSRTDIQSVLEVILQTAGRLCASEYALFFKLQDGKCHLVASNNAEAEYVKYASERPINVD